MCTVSMIADYYSDKWEKFFISDPIENTYQLTPFQVYTLPTKEEVDEFRELLKRAREYDKKNNEPECETQSKIDRLKAIIDKLKIEVGNLEELIRGTDAKSV